MRDARQAVRIVPGGGAGTLDVLGAPVAVLLEGEAAGMLVADHAVPPGYLVPPHVHEQDDEIFYILEGELTVSSEAGEATARAGDCVHLPRGSRHGFRNGTERAARFLLVARPGLQLAEMFRDLDRSARAAGAPLPPDEIVAICARHGIRVG